MAKKKNKENPVNADKAFGRYVKQAARKLPIKECFAVSEWKETGITQIIVARKKPSGAILVGEYLVDLYCLGLKGSGGRLYNDQFEYEAFLKKMNDYRDFEPIDTQLAFNIIYGAIEYAEDIGFEPDPSFAITEYILDDVDEVEFMEIEFGKDGKPFYSSMPYDNVEKIMATLKKNVGEGNFNFLASVNDDDLITEEELDRRMDLLFPEEKIEKRLNALEEEDKAIINVYIRTAEVLLEMSQADIGNLEVNLEYDEFFQDAMEEIKEQLIDRRVKPSEEERMQMDNFLRRTMTFVSERLLEHGNIDFLLDDDFNPTPESPRYETYDQMTKKEKLKYDEVIMKSMTNEERNNYVFRRLFLQEIFIDEDTKKPIPKLIENTDEYYEKIFARIIREWSSESDKIELINQKEEIRKYFDDALKAFWETEDFFEE